jgi:FtsZ-interacting cell division protein YlmF
MGNVLDKAFMDGKEEAKLELTPLLEEARQREEEARQREEEAQREKEEALREKEKARQREEEERRQKEEVLNRLRGTARQLLAKGFSAEEVAGVMGIGVEDVKTLMA